jgi:hypothetical protein
VPSYGGISPLQLHISHLPLAEVLEYSVGPVAIGVPVLESFLASDDEHQCMACRSNDSSLLLASKSRVNVSTPVIRATNFKSPRHVVWSACNRRLALLERDNLPRRA